MHELPGKLKLKPTGAFWETARNTFQSCPPGDNEGGMFILLLSSVIVSRLLPRALTLLHFRSAPRAVGERSLRWKVAGVCSRMLLAHDEMVNTHGDVVCVWGVDGKELHRLFLHWLSCQGKFLLLHTSLN